MIFSASLSAKTKKALDKTVLQTTASNIAANLPLDPSVSNMDCVVLSPDDVSGLAGAGLVNAIEKINPKVTCVYFYFKDDERALIPEAGNIKKHKVKRINPELIKDYVLKSLPDEVAVREVDIVSNDNKEITEELNNEREIDSGILGAFKNNEGKVKAVSSEVYEEELKSKETVIVKEIEEKPIDTMEMVADKDEVIINDKLNDDLSTLKKDDLAPPNIDGVTYPDWDAIRESMKKDKVIRELLTENSQYYLLHEDIEYLEKRIGEIFVDNTKSDDSKISELKSLALKKASVKSDMNDILADRIVSIMTTSVGQIEKIMNKRLDDVKKSLDTVASFKIAHEQEEVIDLLINTRVDTYKELRAAYTALVNTYKVMDASVADFIENLDEGLPTNVEYINEMFSPIKSLFIPQNLNSVMHKVKESMQNNNTSFSAIEEKITSIISLVFKLCDQNFEIIEHQQRLMELYKSRTPEDKITIDHALKERMDIIIGVKNSGVTTSGVMYAALKSRIKNTLLIDLRDNSDKLIDNVSDIMSLDTFLDEDNESDTITRVNKEFLIVKGTLPSDTIRFIQEIGSRLDYYGKVVLLLDDSQVEILNDLYQYALTVYFVVGSNKENIRLSRELIGRFTGRNVARRILFVAPPLNEFNLLAMLRVDPISYVPSAIPYIPEVAEYALKGVPLYDSKSIRTIYEGVFKQ